MRDDPSTSTADAVLSFLESVGRRSEAELYLELFRRLPKESFALVAVEAPVVIETMASFVEQLRLLCRLGLFAPVVVGLFAPSGSRGGSEELAERLRGAGMDPRPHEAAETALPERLRAELNEGAAPIVRFAADRNRSVARRFERLGEIATSLHTRKVVVVRRRGALGRRVGRPMGLAPAQELAGDGAGLSVINLRSDYGRLMGSDVLDQEERALLEQARRLIEEGPEGMAMSIASPLALLKELFTVKGAGTLIKRGTSIECHPSFASLDRRRLKDLVDTSFGKSLSERFFDQAPLAVYLEESYRGAIVLVEGPVAPFLTKFVVDRVAQGEGMARDLWQAIAHDHPSVYWRARPDNPIGPWYLTLADGAVHTPTWNVYWRGIDPPDLPAIIEWAVARPSDFE